MVYVLCECVRVCVVESMWCMCCVSVCNGLCDGVCVCAIWHAIHGPIVEGQCDCTLNICSCYSQQLIDLYHVVHSGVAYFN